MKATSPILTTHALTIGYKTPDSKPKAVAAPLDLKLYGGEMICLLGPNGAGKSTLLRTLAGIQPALAGSISIEGNNITGITALEMAKKVSLVLTDKINVGNLRVHALIELGRYPHTGWFGRLSKSDEAIVCWAMEATATKIYANRLLHTLSDGERQKVMLARALAQDTSLIILDEPTAHLDLPNRVEMFALLHRLSEQTQKAILLSTHDLDLALQTADQLWMMHPSLPFQRGIPEDLVLNGAFENTFGGEGFYFDTMTGTFKIHTSADKSIQVTGEGEVYFWTKRALERKGFIVDQQDQSGGCIEVSQVEGRNRWILRHHHIQREYGSISELVTALKNDSADFEKVTHQGKAQLPCSWPKMNTSKNHIS